MVWVFPPALYGACERGYHESQLEYWKEKIWYEEQTDRALIAPCDTRDRTSYIWCRNSSGEGNADGCYENNEKVDSMATSMILLLFQIVYVLRMKKQSENMPDTILRPEPMLSNNRHLLRFSFRVNFRYRSMMRKTKGRYRVIIYMHFTLLQCDLSKNDHSSCSEHA